LKKYIKTGKDPLDSMSRQDVIYKINGLKELMWSVLQN